MVNQEFGSGEWDQAEEVAERLRDMFEGLWVGVPVVPEGEEFDDEDFDEDVEDMEIYIVQSEEIPFRFLARYRRDDLEGELDMRVLPTALEDGNEGMSVMFTFVEDDEIDMSNGGGFAMGPDDELLVGMMLYHMGPDVPFGWQRTSKDLPEDIREMILFGDWDFDDEDDEDDDDDGPFIIGELQEILGGLLGFPDDEVGEEPDDDEDDPSTNPTREQLVEKSLEEFLLFQSKLVKQLEDGGISTVSALLAASDEELLQISGIGQARLQEIRRIIHAWGLTPSITESYEVDDDLLNHLFRLRVTLDWMPDVWREVELIGAHTMHDLHAVIQGAFEWDDEHLYAFYMSGRYWDGASAIEHPFSDGDVSATEIQLAGLDLKEGQRFVYLFDFGDELRHSIEVVSVGAAPLSVKKRKALPRVVISHGDAPPQYEEWEDEEWDDDEEWEDEV